MQYKFCILWARYTSLLMDGGVYFHTLAIYSMQQVYVIDQDGWIFSKFLFVFWWDRGQYPGILTSFLLRDPTREIPSGQNGPIRPFSPSSQSEHGRIDFILAAHGFSHIINVFFKQLCLGYGTEIKVYSSRASEWMPLKMSITNVLFLGMIQVGNHHLLLQLITATCNRIIFHL